MQEPLALMDDAGQKRVVNWDPDSFWMQRKSKLRKQRCEDDTVTQEALLAVEAKTQQDATTEAREVDWMKFLTARCGSVELALAAVADGVELSKKQTKLLGRRHRKPGRRELKEKDLPKHLRDALAQAKMKEWTGWCHYDTVEILKVQALPRYAQAVPTRFVITDKNEALRTPENPLPVLFKARLVVLGNLERDANFRRDAPTGSLLAQHMVLAWAAAGGGAARPRRVIRKMDAKNAYLQGDSTTRELYLRPPAGRILGVDMKPGSLMKAKAPIYGTGDAARGWWKKIS